VLASAWRLVRLVEMTNNAVLGVSVSLILLRHYTSYSMVVRAILLALTLPLSSPILTHPTGEAGYRQRTEIDPGEASSTPWMVVGVTIFGVSAPLVFSSAKQREGIELTECFFRLLQSAKFGWT
jgi:hypothetical protein